MRIAMIGTGYVGWYPVPVSLSSAPMWSASTRMPARSTVCSTASCRSTNPGLTRLVEKNVAAGRLSFTTDLEEAVMGAEAVFIAVGTPMTEGDGHADLSYVYAAAEEIAHAIDGYTVVVTKSTVPVGTGREVHKIISKVVRRRIRHRIQPGISPRRIGPSRISCGRIVS